MVLHLFYFIYLPNRLLNPIKLDTIKYCNKMPLNADLIYQSQGENKYKTKKESKSDWIIT